MNNRPGRLYGYLSLIVVSIAFFNFSGVSITKYMGATTRKVWRPKLNLNWRTFYKVLDTLRTLVIWIASMLLHFSDERWSMPSFKNQFWLQLAGFIFLITGIFLYSDVLIMPAIRKRRKQSQTTDWFLVWRKCRIFTKTDIKYMITCKGKLSFFISLTELPYCRNNL